jgi:hypothetical protein
MPVVLVDWKPVRRGMMRGFAKVLLGRSLMIADVVVHSRDGKAWAQLPTKPLVVDGKHARDSNGRPRYQPLLEWASDTARNRFSAAVVAAVREADPGALDRLDGE